MTSGDWAQGGPSQNFTVEGDQAAIFAVTSVPFLPIGKLGFEGGISGLDALAIDSRTTGQCSGSIGRIKKGIAAQCGLVFCRCEEDQHR